MSAQGSGAGVFVSPDGTPCTHWQSPVELSKTVGRGRGQCDERLLLATICKLSHQWLSNMVDASCACLDEEYSRVVGAFLVTYDGDETTLFCSKGVWAFVSLCLAWNLSGTFTR